MNRKIYILLTVLLAWSFSLKAQTAQIGSQTAIPGASVSFDIDVAALPANVGAVSLFIGYDPNVLTFTGSVGGTLSGYILNNMVGTNQIGIQWTDPNGADINGTLLTLNFLYGDLGGSCDLTFNPGCEFADILLETITLAYTNGDIGPITGLPTVIIAELTANAGPVLVPITGNGFTANAGAVTLFIDFDPSRLTFTGYTSTLPLVLVSGDNTNGRVSIAYSSTSGSSLNGEFFIMNFDYDATGTSELVFKGGCEITETDLDPIVVSFDNGIVAPLLTGYQMSIDTATADPGSEVGVAITAGGSIGFPDNVGAITLFVGYNPAHMTFQNLAPGTVSGAYAHVITPGHLGITWTNSGGQDIDGIVFTMNFLYNFGSSDITFEGGCDISDITLTQIPTTYINGSIAPDVEGPEVRLPFLTGVVGQTIDFPITAKNFTMNIAAISMFIGFNNSVLTYTGNTPGSITGYYINYMPATSAPFIAAAARRHRLGLVFEPARANGDLVKSRKGTGILTLTCRGRAAHAGRDPAAGRNAILALCELLPSIARLADELPDVMVNIGTIRGGGTANIVPDLAEAVINARVTNVGDDALFLKRLHEVCAPLQAREGYRLEIGGGFNRGPKVETPAETAVFADWRKCAREFGLNLDWQHVGGGSDGNILAAAGLPNLDGLGCVGDHLHSPEEYCHLPSLGQRAQVAALFLHRLAAGEINLPA